MKSQSPDARFSMYVQTVGGDLVVTIEGELDASAAQAVVGLADHRLNVSRRISLDLASVSFIDISGVHALATLRERLLGLASRVGPRRKDWRMMAAPSPLPARRAM